LSETKVRDVRLKDFKAVRRRKPRIESFTKTELDAISAIDIKPLTKKDTEHWRPDVPKKGALRQRQPNLPSD